MAATEPPAVHPDKSEVANAETRTVFNILSRLKESEAGTTGHLETDEDIVIFRRDPATNQSTINKTAYLKLHRSLSPSRNSTIEKIKENYEKPEPIAESVATLKTKYSPSGLGYAKPPQPVAKPRRSKLSRSQIITPSKREQTKSARLSLQIEKNKNKDVNSNDVQASKTDGSSEEEFVTIITRSDSEESVLRFQKELSAFTMDKKKRSNSFRRIFSVFSNKDKKKKDKHKNEVNQQNGDNLQNQTNSFNREVAYRHTTSGEVKTKNFQKSNNSDVPNQYKEKQLERDYSQVQISQFNLCKQNVENVLNQPTNKVASERSIYKSNDPYMNVPNIRKYIDTSSSASTLESDRSNIYQNESLARSSQPTDDEVEIRTFQTNSFRPSRISDGRRDTPPRLLETKQDVRLVNPKALIPINSERPLPNPYQNFGDFRDPRSKPMFQSTPRNPTRLYMDDTYGTVFDSLDNRQRGSRSNLLDQEKSPRCQSVEGTKLRLPPNREIVPLSPRVKSPIPMDNVSTDKLIATELLKPKRSPTPTKKESKQEIPSHQRLEIDIDYPVSLVAKPPISARSPVRKPLQTEVRSSNESVVLRPKDPETPSRITTDVQVHTHSPTNRTPTPNQSLSTQSLSLSPVRPTNLNLSMRPSTPTGSQIPDSPKTTPQKEDIRKSVEAYYWKEIKKLKDRENYELYMMQLHYGHMLPYGYAEDPVSARRSRSMSPLASRNSRRSLSLPRDARTAPNVKPESYYPSAIPENRAVMNRAQPRSVQQLQFQQQQQQQQQYFQRNAPERSTTDGSPRRYDSNSLYRPIFKRGSLSTPPSQLAEDALKRKVSFSGAQSVQSWPTKNGFTQSPPQRRLDRLQSSGEDEVFLPNRPTMVPNEEMYYNTRASTNGEPLYVLRANQNAVYLHQRPIEQTYGPRVNLGQRPMPNQEEVLYGQPIDAVRPQPLSRHGSVQLQEELYGPRRISYQGDDVQYSIRRPPSQQLIRREVIVTDGIFGQFGGYSGPRNNVRLAQPQNIYASRQNVAEHNSRIQNEYYSRQVPKQVSVSNKVCDFYGQIHDVDKGQQSGVLMGQLQQSPGSPAGLRNAHSQMAGGESFVRNSRLTSSANDMYRRVPQSFPNESLYGRIEQNGNGAPNRPLPPVPLKKASSKVSDNESGSDASEIQRILKNSKQKQATKKRGIFGK